MPENESNDVAVASPVEVSIEIPGALDVEALAESTKKSFELLAPWYIQDNSSISTTAIGVEIFHYLVAIEYSVKAAGNGFSVAGYAIALAKSISNNDSTASEISIQDYLEEMFQLAKASQSNTDEALRRFKNVRQNLYALIEAEQQNEQRKDLGSKAAPTTHSLGELQNGISVLEEFVEYVNKFASWWTWMKLEHSTLTHRARQIIYRYDSLRDALVVKKWEELEAKYHRYWIKIDALKDKYPEHFYAVEDFLKEEEGKSIEKEVRELAEKNKRKRVKEERTLAEEKEGHQLEEERKRAKEKKLAEQEKNRVEEDRKMAEEKERKREDERNREEERKRGEEERKRVEEERKRVDEERKLVDEKERKRVEAEAEAARKKKKKNSFLCCIIM